jgi:hypothetical protein
MCGHRSGTGIVLTPELEATWGLKRCDNCGREMQLSSKLCSLCQKAACNKTGEAREAALAEIKERIDNGEVGRGVRWSARRMEETMARKKEPCGNCGRVMAIAGGGGIAGALAEVKKHIASGELGKRKAQAAEAPIVGELVVDAPGREIPVTLRLTIEIGIRITGITQAA